MYIYVYILLLIIFIVIIEIINNFQYEPFNNNFPLSTITSDIKNNKYINSEISENVDTAFLIYRITINNDDKKLMLFNSDVTFSPIHRFNIEYHDNIVKLNKFIGKIYFNIPPEFLDFIHIFFQVDNEEWIMNDNNKIIVYEFKYNTKIRIIYLSYEIKELNFYYILK